MKHAIWFTALVSVWQFAALPLLAEEQPVKIIFDTDITGDVDDVLALAMLHTLADRGQCELLGVTISKVNPLTGPFTDAVNTYYGRPDLPIGITTDSQIRESKYLKLVNKKLNGKFLYRHDLMSNQQAPDAVTSLRKLLSQQPDHSTVIVQVGVAVNLARLLESQPDQYSPLNGEELVLQKVKFLSVMAGAFQPIGKSKRFIEANVVNHISSMQSLADNWPEQVPIIWSGFEIGIGARYPRQSIATDFEYEPGHIVKEAYLLHSGPEHDRPTWDLSSVLYAVFPDRGYYGLTPTGKVTIEEDGHMLFKEGASQRDRALIMSRLQSVRCQEAMVQLVSQPPRR